MIKCKDCKRMGMCGIRAPIRCDENFSCSFAERADGLTMCCATCRHLLDYDDCNAIECELEQFDYTNRAYLNIENLSCPEWQPRERK